jgi:hypothetical protein
MRRILSMRSISVLSAVLVCASCSASRTSSPAQEGRIKVLDLQVGREVGTDKQVTAPVTAFAPSDVIYASVATDGHAQRAVLSARWTFQGALLEETAQTIAAAGKAVSEFHVANPSGWAPGEYHVEILVDGRPAADRAFRVESAS